MTFDSMPALRLSLMPAEMGSAYFLTVRVTNHRTKLLKEILDSLFLSSDHCQLL